MNHVSSYHALVD